MNVFLDSSVGKESACNAGDTSSIPGSRRSPGKGIGYPLQCSWASLVTQLVKNPPAMWETWVWSLSWEDPLEKGKATHSSILAWRIPRTVHGVTTEWLSFSLYSSETNVFGHFEYILQCKQRWLTWVCSVSTLVEHVMRHAEYKYFHLFS